MLTLNWFFYAEDIQTCFLIIPFLVWQSSDLTTHPLLSSIPLLNVIMFIFSCAILATNYSFTYLVTVYLETIRPQFSPFLSNILCIVVYMKYNMQRKHVYICDSSNYVVLHEEVYAKFINYEMYLCFQKDWVHDKMQTRNPSLLEYIHPTLVFA